MDNSAQQNEKKKASPPQWADHFLEWYCAPELVEEIQGDLHEAFHLRARKLGLKKARLLFIIEVLKFFRPSSFSKHFFHPHTKTMAGLTKNYLQVAQRQFLKNLSFSFINTVGLAIGIVAFLLIMHYIRFEQSYDEFHNHADQLYRITLSINEGSEKIQNMATTYPGVGIALKEEFPEVKAFARLIHHEKIMPPAVLSVERQNGEVVKYREEKMYFADAAFLSMFSYPVLAGEDSSALSTLNSVVLTSSTAQKYFGKEDPIGKTMTFDGDRQLTVTAVLADPPQNSHLSFDVLLSYTILQQEDEKNNNDLFSAWEWPAFYTYVLLNKRANPETLEDKLPLLVDKYTSKADNPETKESSVGNIQLGLQAVKEIHLTSDLLEEAGVNGSETMVGFLYLIAIAILLIAIVNYINLSTAKAIERAKEVGLRKSIGASRRSLIFQFFLESVLLSLISLSIALGLMFLVAPYFNQLIGKEVITSIWWQSRYFWSMVGIIFLISNLLAGLYPALLISSFQPKQVLKGKYSSSKGGLITRRILVVFQFTISVALLAATLTIYRQLSFMQEKDLGFDAEQMLVVKAPTLIKDMQEIAKNVEVFQNQMRGQTTVKEITVSNEIPGRELMYTMPVRKASEQENISCYWISTNEHFLDVFQTKVIAGRGFVKSDASSVSPDSENSILINKKAADLLGFVSVEDAVGQKVMLWDKTPAEVVGVVENFHQRSLKEEYEPLIFQYPTYYQTLYFALKVNSKDIGQTLNTVEAEYGKLFPDNPFEYFFLDEYFNNQYQSEQQFGRVFLLFACLAVFIACIGLAGLASFMAVQKTQEIGIRKVFGASVRSILTLLSLDFFKLILISGLIAIPIAYLAMNEWLSNYAFHIDLSWWLMLLPLFIVIGVSALSVIFQTSKAASGNPADSLRYE